jgi:hypothetical protein
LIGAGVSVWVDQYDIRPSEHWDRAIEAAVRACHGMIVILSPRSVASPNVADEVSVAIDDNKSVIPVMVETCVLPLRMTRMHYIDATRDYPGALQRCLWTIKGRPHAGPVAEAGPAPAPAAAPAPSLPPEALAEVERRLVPYMGPITPHLVREAAARASSLAALHEELARRIPAEKDRAAFLKALGGKPPT